MGTTIELGVASDMSLVELTRGGQTSAYGELWRRHSGAVIAATRNFTGFDPDDVVQECFVKILDQIQAGQGPGTAFRAYAIMTARNIAINMSRKRANSELTGSPDETFENVGYTKIDTAEKVLNSSFTLGTFRSLPTRWQEILWYRDVEELSIRECSSYLGMSENATSVLLKRAREGFKQAWIAANLNPERDLSSDCQWVTENLPKYARGKSVSRTKRKLESHLATCPRCAIVAEESNDLHRKLALVLLPALLGGSAASGYVAWIQSGGNQVAATQAASTVATTTPTPSGAAFKPLVAASAGAVAISLAVAGVVWGISPEPQSLSQGDPHHPTSGPTSDPTLEHQDDSEHSPELTSLSSVSSTELDPLSVLSTLRPLPAAAVTQTPTTSPITNVTEPVIAAPTPEEVVKEKPALPDPTPDETVEEAPAITPSTLTAAPVDGIETGIYPQLVGTAVPGAHIHIKVTNDTGVIVTADTVADVNGVWNYTPEHIMGTLTVEASQTFTHEGVDVQEEPSTIGVFHVGDGLRMNISWATPHETTITVTGLGTPTKNQVVNVYSSALGALIISHQAETAPGEVSITVPFHFAHLGELVYWQGDTSEGPKRTWQH
ncbi:MAG: sigma-70 family RNA polymerase sigma factor [Leucobacter sp.]